MDKYLKIDIKPWERRWPGLIGILKAYLPCSCTGQMWIKIFAGGFFLERKKKRKETGRETIFKNYRFTFPLFSSLLVLTLYNLLSIYTCFKHILRIFDSPSSSKEIVRILTIHVFTNPARNFNIVREARVVSASWKRNADLRVLEVAPRRKKEVRNTGV